MLLTIESAVWLIADEEDGVVSAFLRETSRRVGGFD